MIVIIAFLIGSVFILNNSLEHKIIESINKVFNYEVRNINYFLIAFTHKSTSHENYERLEILGDSVIQLAITELLFKKYPKYKEGQITVVRQNLVNSSHLEKIFLSLKLDEIFKIVNPKLRKGNVHSDVLESLLGAIYLDSNYKTTSDIINHLFIPLLNDNLSDKDSKTLLQEYTHSKQLRLPSYSTSIIKHIKYKYLVTCELSDLNIKESLRSNKVKPTEQELAGIILNKLNEKD